MLPRTLEPEVMDTLEEALVYDAMDHGTVNLQFVEDLIAAGFAGGDVLDLGTGTAQIPIALVQRMPDIRVMATDLSTGMLDVARGRVEMASLTHAIQLDRCDAKQLPFADDMFDLVMSNSIVHHLPDPEPALREAWRVVRPQGMIFFRDLMRPDSSAQLEQLVTCYAGQEPPAAQQMFRESLQAALRLDEIRALVDRLTAGGGQHHLVSATSDRHWTWVSKPRGGLESGPSRR